MFTYSNREYNEFIIKFVNLPIIDITSTKDIDSNIERDSKVVILSDSSITYNGKIKIRGTNSRKYPKKSYKLTLDKNSSLLDMSNDDDWILDASYADTSLMRNMIGVELWNQISNNTNYQTNKQKAEYVLIFKNNEYRGIYILREPVDRKM